MFTHAKKGKLFVDSIKIKIFIIKKIYLYFYTYLITYSLELLLISGSTLVESIDIVKDILGNNYLEKNGEKVFDPLLYIKTIVRNSFNLLKIFISLGGFIEITEETDRVKKDDNLKYFVE
jgi:uncharacterized membrane protein